MGIGQGGVAIQAVEAADFQPILEDGLLHIVRVPPVAMAKCMDQDLADGLARNFSHIYLAQAFQSTTDVDVFFGGTSRLPAIVPEEAIEVVAINDDGAGLGGEYCTAQRP